MARRLVGRGLEVRIAEAAIAALCEHDGLSDVCEIGEQCLPIILIDLRAGRDLHHDVSAVRAVAVLTHPGAAVLRGEMLLVAIIDQRVETIHRGYDHIAAVAAVAAVWPAELDAICSAAGLAAVPAV